MFYYLIRNAFVYKQICLYHSTVSVKVSSMQMVCALDCIVMENALCGFFFGICSIIALLLCDECCWHDVCLLYGYLQTGHRHVMYSHSIWMRDMAFMLKKEFAHQGLPNFMCVFSSYLKPGHSVFSKCSHAVSFFDLMTFNMHLHIPQATCSFSVRSTR